MAITKTITKNGMVFTYHILHGASVGFSDKIPHPHYGILSFVDEQAYQDSRSTGGGFSWGILDAPACADYTDHDAIEELLITTGELSGGVISDAAEPPSLLERMRYAKWAEIKAERTRRLTAPLLFNGLLFDADAEGRQNIEGAIQLAMLSDDVDFSVAWTLADNTETILDRAGLIALGAALGSRTIAVFKAARLIRDAIYEETDVDAVLNINWPVE